MKIHRLRFMGLLLAECVLLPCAAEEAHDPFTVLPLGIGMDRTTEAIAETIRDVHARAGGTRLFVHATQLSCDPLDALSLVVAPPYRDGRVEYLRDGMWVPFAAAWQGAKIVIPRPMHVYDMLAVRLSPKKVTAERPLVGAIRWDAWDGGNRVTEVVENTLKPAKYHSRLPWFAQVRDDGSVAINGAAPGVMEREIDYVADAGLDYFIFLGYGLGSCMSGAFERYLSATNAARLVFAICLIGSSAITDATWPQNEAYFLRQMRDPKYVRVCGGRLISCGNIRRIVRRTPSPSMPGMSVTRAGGFARHGRLPENRTRRASTPSAAS